MLFGRCRVCPEKDTALEQLRHAKDDEIAFLREQVRTLEDRLMSLCGSLAAYEPVRRDAPTGDVEQPPYIDPESGKAYRYNETLAMYEEITDREIAEKLRAEVKANNAERKVNDADKSWHDAREDHMREEEVAWNNYAETRESELTAIIFPEKVEETKS